MISKEYSYEKDMQVKQEEARAEGRAEAKMKVGKEIAIRLAEMEMSINDIAEVVDVDITIVKKWLIEG